MKVYVTDKKITRDKIRANPDVLYLFGDNDVRRGLGGQAKEMRGEPNTIGISTKKSPSNKIESYKTDEEFEQNTDILAKDFIKVYEAIRSGEYKALVIPQIGEGLAKLPEKAPKTYEALENHLKTLKFIAERIEI